MLSSRAAVCLCLGLAAGTAWAQAPKRAAAVQKKLTTRDGVELAVTYMPGNKGKKTVPVVLLHGYKGSHNDWAGLARYLHALGHAVVAPDLRGHGVSTKTSAGATLSPSNVNFQAMATHDMEAIKEFLLEKNNEEELNLEKLCVVGAEMGADVAAAYAALDWSESAGKQGQDVKALVLISPKYVFRNLRISDALRSEAVGKELSVLIMVGKENATALAEAARVRGLFAPGHPEPARKEDRDLFFVRLETHLQGAELAAEKKLNGEPLIAEFIDVRLVNRSFPWKARQAAK